MYTSVLSAVVVYYMLSEYCVIEKTNTDNDKMETRNKSRTKVRQELEESKMCKNLRYQKYARIKDISRSRMYWIVDQ